MAETIFQKPLDAQVAANTDAITNLQGKIKSKECSSVTTDANGGFYLGNGGSSGSDALSINNAAVVAAYAASLGSACIHVVGQYGDKWYAQATSLSSGALVKSTNIGNVFVLYFDK